MNIKATFELVFYLIKLDRIPRNPPVLPLTLVREVSEGQLYALHSLKICGELLKSITENCMEMGTLADTSFEGISKGQF